MVPFILWTNKREYGQNLKIAAAVLAAAVCINENHASNAWFKKPMMECNSKGKESDREK